MLFFFKEFESDGKIDLKVKFVKVYR